MTKQNHKDNEVIKAWKEAAKDLGLKIQSPFLLKTDNGKEYEYGLLIEDFGSERGILVLTTYEKMDDDEPWKYGYYSSALNSFHYDKYDRENFIETLNDWGFYGKPDKKPNWFKGHLYTKNK